MENHGNVAIWGPSLELFGSNNMVIKCDPIDFLLSPISRPLLPSEVHYFTDKKLVSTWTDGILTGISTLVLYNSYKARGHGIFDFLFF